MSVGNVSQAVTFQNEDLVLVLGENLDLGGNDSRNGVGKSTIVNALSYALYGEALVKIRKDNLVNKINTKVMMVTIEFDIDGTKYKIERGRKPTFLRFYANGNQYGDQDTDEAQGDSRVTQQEIERVIGISLDMFKQIVALNTYNEPFLSMRSADQRAIIEQLLGITKLSEKAEKLREQLKTVKDEIKEEEFKISATKSANERIEKNISRLERSSKIWEDKKNEKIFEIQTTLEGLLDVDVVAEIDAHSQNEDRKSIVRKNREIVKDQRALEKEIKLYTKNLVLAEKTVSMTSESNSCPTCGSDMDKDTHDQVHSEYQAQADEAKVKIKEKEAKLEELGDLEDEPPELSTFYKSVSDAYDHKTEIETTAHKLEKELGTENQYIEQIASLQKDGIQTIDMHYINELSNMRDHQEFLLKLLINKDSFIRKKIIDQNLTYLNHQLLEYTTKVGLPHKIKFKPDLEVEITDLGRDYDFDNLSRGERTRLILSLSMAFRDVFESLNDRINLLFIDELIDSGLDVSGVEGALGVLKRMTRENKRNVFLISHKDELVGRVGSVLKVIKENGFTTFDITDTNLI